MVARMCALFCISMKVHHHQRSMTDDLLNLNFTSKYEYGNVMLKYILFKVILIKKKTKNVLKKTVFLYIV